MYDDETEALARVLYTAWTNDPSHPEFPWPPSWHTLSDEGREQWLQFSDTVLRTARATA
jgi:hypothetical protein